MTVDNPLSERIMSYFTVSYIRQSASTNWYKLLLLIYSKYETICRVQTGRNPFYIESPLYLIWTYNFIGPWTVSKQFLVNDIQRISSEIVRSECHGTSPMTTQQWLWWLNATSHYLTPWASCQIRKIAGAHAPGMPGTFSPPQQVSDPDMHHGTCVTHVPWCMPGSLTSGFLRNRRWGETFPAFPAHAQTAILRIW